MYHRNHNIHPHIDNDRSINNVMLKQQQQQQQSSSKEEGLASASRYGSILFVDDGNSSVVIGEELDTKIINTAHQQHQHQQPTNAQRKWGIVTANLMVCLFVIAMIIRGSGTMIDNNTNNNDTFGIDGSLITTNNNTTNFPRPVENPTVPDGMTPGPPFFSWKSWGYGVVRDYWDQKKDDWREIEEELHRKNATEEEIQIAENDFWTSSAEGFGSNGN
ncbi:hypothetical protein FRACYDRAFT_263844 [Fragilariopsis cylindrus CCMP1102]|uniref:Transmembrane protein n=1 Tax=Fragilariopsis cylindrus CCMP1102 TaxID=635003 RepID=A0A1E7EW96_9STRA|nr:hypothetical protein FRACYDRAFT_263844 [Fragilariopsis cylindrus CCMP1102]|eukprot:OEU10308.1 hypothetical protein FRACYDRAFT_263844 [Fragilariopsis cylindrus CCMP1102]